MRAIALVAAVLAAGACAEDVGTDPGADDEVFTASLSADAVVANDVVSDATGSAEMVYDGTVLEYTIDVDGMTEATAAHIHGPATTEQPAPVLVTLFSPSEPTGPVSGRLVSGTIAGTGPEFDDMTLDYVLGLMRSDSAFVMVHSSTYPNGEIRGQLVPQQ